MSGRQGGVSGAPAGSVFNMVCPAARQAGCSLRMEGTVRTVRRQLATMQFGQSAPSHCRPRKAISDMNDERVMDWAVLPGEEVQIRKHGQNVSQGRVDAVTGDASVLWIEASGASLRTLFEKSEGYTAWRRARKTAK
jgi:hypothetical protein